MTTTTTNTTAELSSAACDIAVQYLLDEANRSQSDRRQIARQPFFRNVIVAVPHGETIMRYSCFSRDISSGGIGLLHPFPLVQGEVIVTIYSESIGPVQLRGELMWCQPQLEGWHTSGVRWIETLK
jgi:hypothetical protein